MRGTIFLLFIIILSTTVQANIIINEIMSNPDCPDATHCEWIELYNDGDTSIDLSGWNIGDTSPTDDLEGYDNAILSPNSYALIVDDDTRIYQEFNIPKTTIWLYTQDTTIGSGGLLNTGETITLYDNSNNIIHNLTFPKITKGNTWSNINGIFKETPPTPGKNNIDNTTGADYNVIRINEFLPDPTGNDDATTPDGEWVELFNSGTQDLDLLGFKLVDNFTREIIITDSKVETTIIKANSYLTVYMNGYSGFLNNKDLEKIELYDLNNNLIDNVTYSDSREGVSYSLINNIWKLSTPSPGKENIDTNPNISYLSIEKVYLGSDNKAKFGDNIGVKINAYKGDTGRYSVSLWIEDREGRKVTKLNRFEVLDKFIKHTTTLSLQLSSNCDGRYNYGGYFIVLEGIEAPIKKSEIEIIGITPSLCNPSYSKKIGKTLFTLVDIPNEIILNKDFTVKIDLVNSKDSAQEYEIWSYVYKGPISLTGDREKNLKIVKLPANGDIQFELINKVTNAEPGDYKVKVKIKRKDRKTPEEFTKDIKLLANPNYNLTEETTTTGLEGITGGVIYEGSDVKAYRYGLYFFVLVLIGLIIQLAYKETLRKV